MKSHLPIAICSAVLLCIPRSHAQTPQPHSESANVQQNHATTDVTIRGTIISVPNAEATQFSAKQDLSGKAGDAFAALLALVAQKKASSVANPAVTTRSGQRALTESGQISFEVEPVVSPDGKVAELNIVVNDNGHKVTTSVQVSNEAVKFLGSVLNSTDKSMTDYIFVRVSF